jgi:hypothetical protein
VSDHGVFNPVSRSNQILHAAICELLICFWEYAFNVLLHSQRPTRPSPLVGRQFGIVVIIFLDRHRVFSIRPFGQACPIEHTHGKFLEEVLDDVHHVRADVPDDIE